MDRALLFSYFPVDQSQTTITYKKKKCWDSARFIFLHFSVLYLLGKGRTNFGLISYNNRQIKNNK